MGAKVVKSKQNETKATEEEIKKVRESIAEFGEEHNPITFFANDDSHRKDGLSIERKAAVLKEILDQEAEKIRNGSQEGKGILESEKILSVWQKVCKFIYDFFGIEYKAHDINAYDEVSGMTALSCLSKSKSMLELLVEKGADVNARNLNGETAVMIAADAGVADSVKYLESAGANLDVVDGMGNNMLHNIAKQASGREIEKHLEICKFLEEKGVLKNLKEQENADGKTPLDIAKNKSNSEAKLLVNVLEQLPNKKEVSGEFTKKVNEERNSKKSTEIEGHYFRM